MREAQALSGRRFALIALGLAILTQSWVGLLEFQLDDFEQVHEAEDLTRPAVLLGRDSAEQTGLRSRPSFVKYFRPVLHAAFALDVAVFGASPRWLHLSSLFWHVLTVLCFRAVLRRYLPAIGGRAQDLAALVFCVMPGKLGAVTWVAARGDVLAALFLLMALLALGAWRRRGGPLRAAALLGAVLASMLAKEGALTTPLIVGAADIWVAERHHPAKGRLGRFLPAVLLSLLAPAMLLTRRLLFGEYANYYAGQVRSFSLEIIGRMVDDFVPVFDAMIGGWFHHPEGSLAATGQSLLGGAVVLGLLVWTARRPFARLRLLGALLACYLVTLLPILRFYREAAGFDASRLFYMPALYAAVAVALPLEGLRSRLGLLRLASFLLAALLAASWGLAYWKSISANLQASRIVARVRQDLNAIASTAEEPCAYLVTSLPTDVDHVPTYGSFLGHAFRDTFNGKSIEVRALMDEELLLRQDALYTSDYPVQVLRWDGTSDRDGGRLVPATGVLPGPKGLKPAFDLAPGQEDLDLAEALRPRDLRAIGLRFDRRPTEPFVLDVRAIDRRGTVIDWHWDWKPLHGSCREFAFSVHRDRRWLYAGEIVRFELRSRAETGSRCRVAAGCASTGTPPACRIMRIASMVSSA